jgi:hypothetical protein
MLVGARNPSGLVSAACDCGCRSAFCRQDRGCGVVEAAHEGGERVAPESLLFAGGEQPAELERGEPFAERVERDRSLGDGGVRGATAWSSRAIR